MKYKMKIFTYKFCIIYILRKLYLILVNTVVFKVNNMIFKPFNSMIIIADTNILCNTLSQSRNNNTSKFHKYLTEELHQNLDHCTTDL